jgi:hypothetical protein
MLIVLNTSISSEDGNDQHTPKKQKFPEYSSRSDMPGKYSLTFSLKLIFMGIEIIQFKQRTFFDDEDKPNIWNELLKFTQSRRNQGNYWFSNYI